MNLPSQPEPDPYLGARREFTDGTPGLFPTLNHVRDAIDEIDIALVDLLVIRGLVVHDATRFKHNRLQVLAVERQSQVINGALQRASVHPNPLIDYPELVRDVFTVLVEGSVQRQLLSFDNTRIALDRRFWQS